jgi:hypothetical protein
MTDVTSRRCAHGDEARHLERTPLIATALVRLEETSVRDPHVQVMHYHIGSGEGISYHDPEPLSFTNYLGAFDLADNRLHVTPAEHFANEEDARRAVEPFLRAWEIDSDLSSNIGMIRFKFERVELVDRDPPPPGSPQVINIKAASMVLVGASASLHITCRKYPQPPTAFRATLEAQHAHRTLRDDGIKVPQPRRRSVTPRRTERMVDFYATIEVAA